MAGGADLQELLALSTTGLMARALELKLANRGREVALCAIINAKSGKCSEDCRFCAQSAHYSTDAPVYPLKGCDEVLVAANQALEDGAEHFSMVTSGRGLGRADVDKVAEIVAEIRRQVPIKVCASLGILGPEEFNILREAGICRYHHNLESSREFFPRIVSTHTFEDRINTIRAAQAAGLEVCAGGIFGLGESEADRISMALSLQELEVESVPINILIPLPGTPLHGQKNLGVRDILRSIALYRILLPTIPIRLAAGRESALDDFLSTAFLAGADGMMIGGYLTERGRSASKDTLFIEQIRQLWE